MPLLHKLWSPPTQCCTLFLVSRIWILVHGLIVFADNLGSHRMARHDKIVFCSLTLSWTSQDIITELAADCGSAAETKQAQPVTLRVSCVDSSRLALQISMPSFSSCLLSHLLLILSSFANSAILQVVRCLRNQAQTTSSNSTCLAVHSHG